MNTSIEHDSQLILVLGGTGKTGRRVVERLEARDVPTRVGSRGADVPFDWHDEATWASALEDVESVYVSFYPDLAVPGAVALIRSFVEHAVQSGVRRLVLLSGRGEEEAQRCESIVRESGVEWTILRASWFAQNFSEGFMRDLVNQGVVALPAGDAGEPFIDVEDIADVAVAALTESGHAGQLYELTGPRVLTFSEVAGEIAGATGRDIRYEPVSTEVFTSTLAEQNVPADFVGLLTYLFEELLDGRNAHLADGVERALGRAPRDFAQYARATAATGAWIA